MLNYVTLPIFHMTAA